MTENPLKKLADEGQSVWCDQLSRPMIENRELEEMIQNDGLKGVTSNPTIFHKSIGGHGYDDAIERLAKEGKTAFEIYDDLTQEDIRRTADIFRPIYDETKGADGYVSLEVNPDLAHDTSSTIAEAQRLFKGVDRPNVMIKVPATQEGIPAVQTLISQGININVTLIFSVNVYEQVARAYIAGIKERKARGEDVSRIGSVASFFVSRIDTAVDKELDTIVESSFPDGIKTAAGDLRGQAAIANARIAYMKYKELFDTDYFHSLGALPQRCLWASTSTKDPKYRDVIYVEELIGPDTVNTLPPATIVAFRDHGTVTRSLDAQDNAATVIMNDLEEVGVDFEKITEELKDQGVRAFSDSFEALIKLLDNKKGEYRK